MKDIYNTNEVIKNIQLEITLRCNSICANCNRMVGIAIPKNSDMTLSQIELFIKQTKARHLRVGLPLNSIQILGGEPLIHPHFIEIYRMIKNELQNLGIVGKIEVYSNGKIPVPDEVANITKISLVKDKTHANMYVSPHDERLPTKPCQWQTSCGIVLNAYGYFPCGTGSSIIRLFRWNDKILQDFPDTHASWDYSELCPHCVHGCFGTKEFPATSDFHAVPISPRYADALKDKNLIQLKRFGD